MGSNWEYVPCNYDDGFVLKCLRIVDEHVTMDILQSILALVWDLWAFKISIVGVYVDFGQS